MIYDQMRDGVKGNLSLDGGDIPGHERVLYLLNRAKNWVAAKLEYLNENQFVTTDSFSVTSGDASITLPTDFRRLVGLTRVDGNREIEVPVFDRRAPDLRRGVNFWLYRQGNTLQFNDYQNGAPDNMTLLMRYAAWPADLDGESGADTYDYIDEVWNDVIVAKATVLGSKPGGGVSTRFQLELAQLLETLEPSSQHQIADKPMAVKWVDDEESEPWTSEFTYDY